MGVKDVFGAGGDVPEPAGDVKAQKKDRDFVDELKETRREALKERVYFESLGIEPRSQATKSEEKLGINVGDIIKAQADMVNGLLKMVVEMAAKRPEDPYYKHLEDELKEIKSAPTKDSFEEFLERQDRLEKMAQYMKQHFGFPGNIAVGGADMEGMVKLEGMKIEAEDKRKQWEFEADERRRQWDAEREERKRRWEIEDRKWQAEFKLKELEFLESRDNKKHAREQLEDLAGALFGNLKKERTSAVSENAGMQLPSRPQSFKCQECGAMIKMEPPNAPKLKCPKCAMEYEIKETKDQSPADSSTEEETVV